MESQNEKIISVRYKIQYTDNRKEWRDFGPFLFLSKDRAKKYFLTYWDVVKTARVVQVVEEVDEYIER
jgi:hypothetical protein